jgi:CubicO group peptidase (beta-lactamase class C family)
MPSRSFLSLVLLVSGACAQADVALQDFLSTTLAAARDKAHLPAVAALIQIDGKIEADAALGVRELGHPEPAGLDDRWHLGSDTKAMTATMIARLAERNLLGFDETLAQIFPGIAARMDPQLCNVTVTQLLSHTSGLAPLATEREMAEFLAVIDREKGMRSQRAVVAMHYLTRPPTSKVGEFAYSNLGYTIAGAAAEARTGYSWEELIEREIWKPLGIRHAGFGAPGKPGKIDQPRGHVEKDGKLVALEPRTPGSDNPPAVGPAGTANITLGDWLLFAQDQLDGIHGHGKLLKPESYRKLHTPVTKNYALGWGVLRDKDGSISMLTHMGSNGFWVSDVRIMPKHDVIFLTAMNAGGPGAESAARDIGKTLQEKLKTLN